MEFTIDELKTIVEKLKAAQVLLYEASSCVREKDADGTSELFSRIDTHYNDIDDTLIDIWDAYPPKG